MIHFKTVNKKKNSKNVIELLRLRIKVIQTLKENSYKQRNDIHE